MQEIKVNDGNVENPSKLQIHNELPLVSLVTSLLTLKKKWGIKGTKVQTVCLKCLEFV